MPDIESIHMPNVFFYDHSSTLQVTGVIACRHCVSPSSLSSDILYLYRRCETRGLTHSNHKTQKYTL